jgi:hypothetical protein
MFGTFSESALAAYEELARASFKEKKIAGKQGTEYADTAGVGETDSSYLDTDESQDADDYSESYDFTTCIRSDGSLYGISRGKCRKGSEVDRPSLEQLKAAKNKATTKDRKAASIQKRGERAVTRARAEQVLGQLQKQGATAKKATERREKAGGGNREEQVRRLSGKVFLAMDKLRQRAKKMKPGPQRERVLAKVERLQAIRQKLDKEQRRLREQGPKPKSEGFGKLPDWATTGWGLA